MTEQIPPAEPVPNPKSEPEQVGLHAMVINRQRKRQRRKILYLLCGVTIAAGIGVTIFKSWHNGQWVASHISRPPSLDSTPAGRQLAESPRYKQNLDTVNQRDAKTAAEKGESFVATPDEALRDIDAQHKQTPGFRKPVAPANPPQQETGQPSVQVAPVAAKSPVVDYTRIDQLASQIAAQALSYQRSWQNAGSTNMIIVNEDLYRSPAQRRQAWAAHIKADPGNEPIVTGRAAINAGQLSFARIINAADSDTPGPVIAEIAKKGPLYGSRLIGAFKLNETNNALIVEFDRLIRPDGSQMPVSAYAVDASNGALGIRSELDHRYFLRYAPLIAASFIEGLGSTLANSGSRVFFGPQYTIATNDTPRFEQGLYAGAGKVGQRMAQDIEALVPKGPLVKLKAGSLIGVLFLQTVPL